MKNKDDSLRHKVNPPSSRGPGRDLSGIRDWVFDLDNTLYSAGSRLFDQVDQRMGAFIADHFGIAAAEARVLQKRYFRTYGTTLRGLMLHHDMAPEAYLDYVHDIDLSLVSANLDLDAVLDRLAGRKTVFTNGSLKHAEAILDRLGIARHFSAIFDVAAAGFVPKPDPGCYRKMLDALVIAPERAVLFEDTAENLPPAAALGMTTVLVVPPDEPETTPAPDSGSSDYPGEAAKTRRTPDGHIHFVTDDLVAWLRDAAVPRH